MNGLSGRLTMAEFDGLCRKRLAAGAAMPAYVGPLERHVRRGDLRLARLRYDDSAAAMRLWSFLLTEEERLHAARAAGLKIVGTMKDLGTAAVMAYSLPNLVAFYPDGAWWTPCVMEMSEGLMAAAQSVGLGEAFCPVRAMAGAFINRAHFPIPDLLTCSVGSTCDDFSAVAQRVESLGHPILWWEMPSRRRPEPGEPAVELPGGFSAPASQVAVVRAELERVRAAMSQLAGLPLGDAELAAGIREANRIRGLLGDLRRLAYTAEPCPMPALEMLIAEMLAIHFCSDRAEAAVVLTELLEEVRRRVDSTGTQPCAAGLRPAAKNAAPAADTRILGAVGQRPTAHGGGPTAHGGAERAARLFWVNPVADLRVMNLVEECGARLCGTEFLFCHALDRIPEDLPPMEALARTALADPMAGPSADRAARVVRDAREFGAEGIVISRIPGASHCALEGAVIRRVVQAEIGLPVVELEVPPVADPMWPTLKTRLGALVETVIAGRKR
jgi:hypothetical protein